MANLTLKTRIRNKYDIFTNWVDVANDPVLLKGEFGLVEVPAETGATVQEPVILIKVGNGNKKFSELPFAGAIAADVYSWAKEEKKPTYTANEIVDIDVYIANHINELNNIDYDSLLAFNTSEIIFGYEPNVPDRITASATPS